MFDAKALPIEQIERAPEGTQQAQLSPHPEALRFAEESGILEPVVVRPTGNPGFPRYELLSGESSWTIAQQLLLPTVPALILLGLSDREAALYRKVHQQVHRQRLGGALDTDDDPLQWAEFARAFLQEKRRQQPAYSQRALAQELQLPETTLSHGFRMLDRLHPAAREALRERQITLGHAKALTGIPKQEQPRVVDRIVIRGASVRDIERAARERRAGRSTAITEGIYRRPADAARLEGELSRHLGVPVTLAFDRTCGRGTVTLAFDNLEIFDGILDRLGLAHLHET